MLKRKQSEIGAVLVPGYERVRPRLLHPDRVLDDKDVGADNFGDGIKNRRIGRHVLSPALMDMGLELVDTLLLAARIEFHRFKRRAVTRHFRS